MDKKTRKVVVGFMAAAMMVLSACPSFFDDEDDEDTDTQSTTCHNVGAIHSSHDSANQESLSTGQSKGGLGSVVRSSAAS